MGVGAKQCREQGDGSWALLAVLGARQCWGEWEQGNAWSKAVLVGARQCWWEWGQGSAGSKAVLVVVGARQCLIAWCEWGQGNAGSKEMAAGI